ncbi:hypothetical protein P879_06938 [Paragonimus westermani]|uniref:ER lumen protein-retaining receptor n=1 Tax=Paragonimus westermani TaxID=34504 RepID=A0A8T0DH66_9TREM|nr:hypothetical protein P879_06938 [Paragonimus westermani]
MNIFRFFGDASHFVAIIILLLKIWKTRSCSGLSGRSQIAFALVFTTRYLDLFTTFVSLYNSCAKIIFIITSYATVYLMYKKFRATYDSNHDTFRLEFLLIPCAILALLVNERFTFLELFLISKTAEAETITSHYLFALGSYRALYILNWAYRYFVENHLDVIAVVAGIVQTLLYCDFFYLYVTRVVKGKSLAMPA